MKIQINMSINESRAINRMISKFSKEEKDHLVTEKNWKFGSSNTSLADPSDRKISFDFKEDFILDLVDLINDTLIALISAILAMFGPMEIAFNNLRKKWGKTPEEEQLDIVKRSLNHYPNAIFMAAWKEPKKITREDIKRGKGIHSCELSHTVCTEVNDIDRLNSIIDEVEANGYFDLTIYEADGDYTFQQDIDKAASYLKRKAEKEEKAAAHERSTYRPIVETFEDKKKELEQKINDLTEIIESNRESLSEAMDDPSISIEEYKVLMEAQYNRIKERRELRAKLEELSKE